MQPLCFYRDTDLYFHHSIDPYPEESVSAPSSRRARANAIPSWLLPPVIRTGPLKSNFMPPSTQDPPQQGACLRPSDARRTARRTGSPPHRVGE